MCHTHKEPETAEEHRQMLLAAKEELRVMELVLTPVRNRIKHLKETCPHDIVCNKCGLNYGDACPDDKFCHLGARCTICEISHELGWFCPDSPDHLCHYEKRKDDKGSYVILLNGSKFYLADGVAPYADYNWDWCIFCHQPEERK